MILNLQLRNFYLEFNRVLILGNYIRPTDEIDLMANIYNTIIVTFINTIYCV